jgi:hypothetical protein
MENMKKTHDAADAKQKQVVVVVEEEEDGRLVVIEEESLPQTPSTEPQETPSPEPVAAAPLKKKKKKTSYKSLMKGITAGTTKERDTMKERESIQGIGGGNFKKVEKI